jgi:hypothetical protein
MVGGIVSETAIHFLSRRLSPSPIWRRRPRGGGERRGAIIPADSENIFFKIPHSGSLALDKVSKLPYIIYTLDEDITLSSILEISIGKSNIRV